MSGPDAGYRMPDVPDTRFQIPDKLNTNNKDQKMKKAMSYRDLDIFKLAMKLAIEIHRMTLELPKFELFEEGSQIRRSSKSIVSFIVEGFALRNYRAQFLHCILRAIAECDETQIHLELLFKTNSLKDKEKYEYFRNEYNKLARMLNKFYEAVLKQHISLK